MGPIVLVETTCVTDCGRRTVTVDAVWRNSLVAHLQNDVIAAEYAHHHGRVLVLVQTHLSREAGKEVDNDDIRSGTLATD